MKLKMEYSDFLPIWKEFIGNAESVLNVQMVAHHFYNLGLQASPQTKPLSDEEIQNIWYQHEKWLATVPLSFARAIEERHGII